MVGFLGKRQVGRARRDERAEGDLARRLVTHLDPTSATSEAYRTLRTNLLYAVVDNPPKVIVLTSPGPGEGKSTTCANLGVALAQTGSNTLILDCDLRRPVLHKFFGLPNLYGITDVLIGANSLQEVCKQPVSGLTLIPVGSVPLDPAEIIGSQRFSTFITGVREQFDYVLIDASPIGLVSDPAILATQGDGVLLVLDAQNTRKGAARQALRSLQVVGAPVLGAVMNNVKASEGGRYYYPSYTYTRE